MRSLSCVSTLIVLVFTPGDSVQRCNARPRVCVSVCACICSVLVNPCQRPVGFQVVQSKDQTVGKHDLRMKVVPDCLYGGHIKRWTDLALTPHCWLHCLWPTSFIFTPHSPSSTSSIALSSPLFPSHSINKQPITTLTATLSRPPLEHAGVVSP